MLLISGTPYVTNSVIRKYLRNTHVDMYNNIIIPT